MRKWASVITISALLLTLVVSVACTRSKLGPAPTTAATQQVTAAVAETPTPKIGETVVSVEGTPTTVSPTTASPTTASPTTASPTSTSEPSATPLPTMTPTPTTAVEPTPTTPVSATPGTGAAETEFEYVVKTGDTLWGLAQRFGTTVDAIRAKNGLAGNVIYKDQDLVIPASGDGEAVTHVVQIGENLFRISLKYGTTVEAIAAANNIINPNLVYAGQQLTIVQGGQTPGGSTGVRYHVVQPGETLWSIAMRYGTTPWNIAAANGIANINFIYAGRTLRIP
jgi:LysM repeat protein